MVALGGAALGPTIWLLVGMLGMGIADWLPGSDDGDDESDTSAEGGDALFDESADDDLGDFGDMDDLDGMDDMEDAGDDAGDIAPRVDELENEVAEISSTVSTVRSENEAMSETVEEVEENVRKLLEIYEMVTKGVNPFVDDAAPAAGGMDAGGDGFALFDDEDDEPEDLDEEVVDADPDSFFDEDFDDFDRAISTAGSDYGVPFEQLFEDADWEFGAVDPDVFGPAQVTVDVVDGPTYTLGETDEDVLADSFGL